MKHDRAHLHLDRTKRICGAWRGRHIVLGPITIGGNPPRVPNNLVDPSLPYGCWKNTLAHRDVIHLKQFVIRIIEKELSGRYIDLDPGTIIPCLISRRYNGSLIFLSIQLRVTALS